MIDAMESSGLVARQASAKDRRTYNVVLTKKGAAMLKSIGEVAREHAEHLLTGLNQEQRQLLASLLDKIAQQQQLTPGVHPGYARPANT
jgi:DNA-binding MarR family transcriptional regulator